MNRREFIDRYKDNIIAEPSGRTYAELLHDRIKEFVLINSMEKR